MNDRKLLELAAKADGWTGWRSKHGYWNITSPEGKTSSQCHNWGNYDSDTGNKLAEPTFADALIEAGWNPLTDDGDALRLAVKLSFFLKREDSSFINDILIADDSSDPYDATRRAIVRAAAEVGKEMK